MTSRNASPADPAPSLGAAFERVARVHGGSVAVADDVSELSYAELAARAAALRDRLLAAGVRRGERVGICLERSAEVVVAVLGVLQAGAAYVPLEPSYPEERLRFIARDAAIGRIVGDPAVAGRLRLDGVELIATAGADASVPAPAPPELGRDDPAYVIYTSGSTGLPKGVVVTHGNVLALIEGTRELFDFTAEDRWSVFHSFNFDVSVWELWRAFADGACAIVVPDDVVRSPTEFAGFLADRRITVLNQIPSVFRYVVLAWEHEGRPPLALRHVIFAGDAIDLATVKRFATAAGERRPAFTNMYGITEITVHATFKRLGPEDWETPTGSPIGHALPHLEILLLDDDGRPVPDGELGEMWVAGAGVAQGYLNRPELTAERFRTLTLGGVERRAYRSGDLAWRRDDGELEFAGRNDQQVKVRGYRIEPGEIEAALLDHEAVRTAAVVVAARPGSEKTLTAVVLPDGPAGADLPEELRRHCEARLPAHMVPARFRLVEEMPETPSGKIDRRALADLPTSVAPAGV